MSPSVSIGIGLLGLVVSVTASNAGIPITTFGGPGYQPDVGAGLTFDLNGLSSDGSTVFGGVTGTSAGTGFWWTRPDALHFLPEVPKYASYDGTALAGPHFYWSKSTGVKAIPFTVSGLSSDGTTLIGRDSSGGVRWTVKESVQRLNFNPLAVSANGGVVAGDGGPRSSEFDDRGRDVVLWTREGGEKNLGNLSYEYDPNPVTLSVSVSRDGRVVTGDQFVLAVHPPFEIFISIDGAPIRVAAGGALSGGVSPDGSVLYGNQYRSAARWTVDSAGVISETEGLAGGIVSDSSFDGSVMVISPCCGEFGYSYWDAQSGAAPFKQALHSKGVDIDPEQDALDGTAAFVSDSGRVFATDLPPFTSEFNPSFWLTNLDPVPEAGALTWVVVGLLGLLVAAKSRVGPEAVNSNG